jgi:transcriptional pleiotropic regulator of transition state genes
MKSTGMVRKVDELGRIVLPSEIRQSMDIKVRDALEIFTDEGRIVLQKYEPSCIFCTSIDNIVYYKNKRICGACLAKLREMEP